MGKTNKNKGKIKTKKNKTKKYKGSDEIIKNNRRVMASGLVKIQFKCKNCGKLHSKTDK